ncbi:MAG: aminotransferase class I/II-fold pyridoxal phosphate-dependent enzyme [Methanomassiliicoccales archaeon]|nr:MAG: aminotransferase class I/II-fold pyridoxal phosphate-dependent enzyme [Methanomassiliicoccales archaeon]
MGLSTRSVDAGEIKGIKGSVNTPIFQTSTFFYPTDDEETWKGGLPPGTYIYSRHGNPTVQAAEDKIAALEGAERALVFSSGMAATSATVFSLLSKGDRLVSMEDIYGGTYNLFKNDLSRLGVTTDFVPSVHTDDIIAALKPGTKLLWLECPTNPLLKIIDIPEICRAAKEQDVMVAVDSTFASPYNMNPLEMGADIVMHSCTKYLNGHSDLIAGAVAGRQEIINEVWKRRITMGGTLDPMGAFLLLRGMKTLAIRMRQHNENAMTLATYLLGHEKVQKVHYPGLPCHPQHELAKKMMRGFGGMVSFEVRGGVKAAEKVMRSFELINVASSLGGVESLASMPLNTSHTAFSAEERRKLGIADSMIRLSVGIEDVEDLIDDLERSLGHI